MKIPTFDPLNYEATVKETIALGDVIVRVTATDADRRVSEGAAENTQTLM